MRAVLGRWKGRSSRAVGEGPSDQTVSEPSTADVRVGSLRTAHDTFLAVKDRQLDQTSSRAGHARLLWEPGCDLGLLVGDGLVQEFALGASTPRALAHLVKLEWRSETSVAIADLWTRTWLSPAPEGEESDSGPRFRSRCTTVGRDETLMLEPGGAETGDPLLDVAKSVYARVRRLRQGAGVSAEDVLDAIACPDAARAAMLFSSMLPLLSRDALMKVARAVVSSDVLVSTLAGLFPTDPWASRSLPELHNWLQNRDAGPTRWRTRSIGTDLDVLWRAGPGDVAASSGEVLNFYARRQVRPRRRVCVVATARNEGVYLLEWLAYYRALGVDEFFVYSNNNEDHSDALLAALAEAGAIRWLDSEIGPRTKAQAKAYAHAYSVLPDVLDFHWAMTIDIDEFLVLDPVTFDGLGDFLDWHSSRQTDVVGVNWVVVGPSGLTRWSDDLVTRRFPARIAPVDAHVKSISRPGRVLGSQPHFPYTTERERLAFREATGEVHTWFTSTLRPRVAQAQSDDPTTGHAALHHYALKSCEEFLWKFSRNRGGRIVAATDGGMALTLEERFVARFLGQYEKDAGDVRPAVQATVPHLEREIEELRRLDGVADAEQLVKKTFVERSARVMEAYRTRLQNDLGESGRQLLRLIDEEGDTAGA